jgi:hypothetical protein
MSKEAARQFTIDAIRSQLRTGEPDSWEADNDTKKFLIVSYYNLHKLDPQVIHEATGFALDFIYSTLREFAHRCVVRSVRERIKREIPKD